MIKHASSSSERISVASVATAGAILLVSAGESVRVQASGAQTTVVAAGDLEPSFGGGGKVFTPFPLAGEANAVAIQRVGKIVAAGYMTEEITNDTY